MTLCQTRCKFVSLIITIVSFLVVGICVIALCKTVYTSILYKELTIQNNSQGYEFWKETPIPMYLNIYLFNWTNAEDVIRNWTIKPVFEECGPYVFSEHHIRVNLTWNDKDNSITYYQKKIWHFESELSTGSLDDNITNVNVIAATAAYLVRKNASLLQRIVSFFISLKEKSLVQTRTVDEWTFKGYDDELLKMLLTLNISGFNIPYSKFGWFYGRNNSETYDGNFTMYTGVDDLKYLGILNKWNNVSWTGDYSSYCGVVNGTSGELWPPVNDYNDVALFTPDLCSTIWLSYNKNYTEEILGLRGKQFIGTDYIFDNGTKYPEQACFNSDKIYPSGVRDISVCKFGAPAFVSYPHFYLADPYYRNSVVGMNPNRSKHEFYVILEPNTGIPLNVKAGMQLNLLVQPVHSISLFKNVKTTFVPMVWFSQTATLTDKLGNKAKLLLTVPSILVYTGSGFIVIAILIMGISIYLAYKNRWNGTVEETLLNNED